MLPDFPEFKTELSKFILAKIRGKINNKDPLLASIRRFVQHEGRRFQYEQMPSGEVVEQPFEEASSEVETSVSEVPTLFGPNLEKKLEDLANQTVSQMAKSFFKKVGEASEQAGTSVDAKGKPISPELLMEAMEKFQMEFDSSGNPTTTLVFHPDMFPAYEQIARQIDNDPELKHRHEQILRQQREAWAARENNRKLAD